MGLVITTLFMASFTAGALVADGPATAIQPDEALRRAAQLRIEAFAHQEMEREVAAQTGGTRRDRRWRKTMVALCREYAAAASRASGAYEVAAAPDAVTSPGELRPHAMLPVTAAEYAARASDYEVQAESPRADADRHISMMRSSLTEFQDPVYGSGRSVGQRRSGGWFQAPKERSAREHCENVVQQSLALARDADNIAKHFRLRARQLESAPPPIQK